MNDGGYTYEAVNKALEAEGDEEENELSNAQVLRQTVAWEPLRGAGLISDQQLTHIKNFDKKPADEREALLDDMGATYAELFTFMVTNVTNKEQLQYVLAIIDELLQDKQRILLFVQLRNLDESLPYTPFRKLLTRSDDAFITSRASRIMALLMSEGPSPPEEDTRFLSRWAADQLRSKERSKVSMAITALQRFLRRDAHRTMFVADGGLKLLANTLLWTEDRRQQLYQTIYCLWLLSYNHTLAAQFSGVEGLVKGIVEAVRREEKEKIRRLGLATLRNIMDRGENNEQMITAGMLKVVGYLSQKKWGDEDIEEDIKLLSESLEKNMIILSSFETYKEEVLKSELTWSPVHRSERFWRENVGRFEEDNFRILTVLLDIIRSSDASPVELSIACFDLGEFVRFHPRGRRILSQLEGKIDIMKLMAHPDEEVQKHALMCVQKMMVHNWEYLARASTSEVKKSS